jgi:SAM-dependent methyltransferase
MKAENRFTKRVDSYVKYRPHYPAAVYDWLLENGYIGPDAVIADAGCGTGISSELFLKRGHTVYGIDPNAQMLEAARSYLSQYPSFHAIHAGAEATSLPGNAVHLVLAAQAFHWFDKEAAKTEFKRILKPGGHVALLWNDRRTGSSDFLKVYEDFLQMFGTDYREVDHKNTQQKQVLEDFFGGSFTEAAFENSQLLDLEGLKGRVLSSSYMPDETHPDHEFMMYCLRKIFNRYEKNGTVSIDYDSRLYIALQN